MSTPRPFTDEEMRNAMFEHMAAMLRYWRDLPTDKLMKHQKGDISEIHHRMEGFLFSLLVMFDGGSADMPGLSIVPIPHEDDEAFCRSLGQNWWAGEMINDDATMHEIFPWEKCK